MHTMKDGLRSRHVPLLLAGALVLGGCAKQVKPPVANAGSDQMVDLGQVVQLDGSMSSDPAQRPLYYHWSFASLPTGSAAHLNDASVVDPSFRVDVPGSYVVDLVVSNGFVDSLPAKVTITASQCGGQPPVLVAGSLVATPASGLTGQAVAFAAQFTDADQAPPCSMADPLSYSWSLVAAPPGSAAPLLGPATASPSLVPEVAGSYTVQVVAIDSTGLRSDAATVTFTVAACGNAPPGFTGAGAVAPAASTSTPNVGQTIGLSATAADPDNTPPCSAGESIGYAWSIASAPVGSTANLAHPASQAPSFTPDKPGVYLFQVVATDSAGQASSPAKVQVTAGTCGSNPPNALAAVDSPFLVAAGASVSATVPVGASVQVDASASSDADSLPVAMGGCGLNEPLTYAWRFTGLPFASNASLNNPSILNPTFDVDVPGIYTLLLTVSDATASATAMVTINGSPIAGVALPAGYSASVVSAGGAAGWDRPMGLTGDSAGNIYVAQNGSGQVLKVTPAGAISVFATGGALSAPLYIAFNGGPSWFVSDASGVVLSLAGTGAQTIFTRGPGGFTPFGLSLGAVGGSAALAVLDQGNNGAEQYAPGATPPAPLLATDFFAGGGGPGVGGNGWGVALARVAGSDVLFATDQGRNRVVRSSPAFNGAATAVTLSNDPVLNSPTDLVFNAPSSLHAAGSVLVADSGSGAIVGIDNCGAGRCTVTIFASGFGDPEGLWLNPSLTQLYVTDRARNALVKISGDFTAF